MNIFVQEAVIDLLGLKQPQAMDAHHSRLNVSFLIHIY